MWSHPGLIFVTDAGHTHLWVVLPRVRCTLGACFTADWFRPDVHLAGYCVIQIQLLFRLKILSRPGLSIYSCIFPLVSQSMRFSVFLVFPSRGFSRDLFRNGFSGLLELGAKKLGLSQPLPFSWECCLPSLFFFCSTSNLLKEQYRRSEPLSVLARCLLLHSLPRL